MTNQTRYTADLANVLGIGVHAVDMEQSVARMQLAIEEGRKGYVCLAGAHGIVEALCDPELRAIFANAYLVAPNDIPPVWTARFQGLLKMRQAFNKPCNRPIH